MARYQLESSQQGGTEERCTTSAVAAHPIQYKLNIIAALTIVGRFFFPSPHFQNYCMKMFQAQFQAYLNLNKIAVCPLYPTCP